jgi:hypothetical protein
MTAALSLPAVLQPLSINGMGQRDFFMLAITPQPDTG